MDNKSQYTTKRKSHKTHKLSRKQIELKKKRQRDAEISKVVSQIPIYKFPDVLPLIYEIHLKMQHRTPLKVASTCFLLWAVFAGITTDRPNLQLFVPLFDADSDLGVICRDVYSAERRHKFDYMPARPMHVDKFTAQLVDYVIGQADELDDQAMIKLTKRDQAYQYAIANHEPRLEPYIIINQYATWINAVTAKFNHDKKTKAQSHPNKSQSNDNSQHIKS